MTAGLFLFVSVIALDPVVLLFDLILGLQSLPTVTGKIWVDPLLGILVVLWHGIGLSGLLLHLFG